MKSKLTLTIEKETKERAKRHAKKVGKSVSQMVEEFLDQISEKEEWTPPAGSTTAKLSGSLPISGEAKNKNYKKLLAEALEEKYDYDAKDTD